MSLALRNVHVDYRFRRPSVRSWRRRYKILTIAKRSIEQVKAELRRLHPECDVQLVAIEWL